MVDRRPQDFPNGTPDGVTDNTQAIQAAIDAWQPGDQVVIAGGTFRTSGSLTIAQDDLLLKGDGKIRAKSPSRPTAPCSRHRDRRGARCRRADPRPGGRDRQRQQHRRRRRGRAAAAQPDLASARSGHSSRSRPTPPTSCSRSCDHLGKGYGVIAPDPPGVTRLTIRDSHVRARRQRLGRRRRPAQLHDLRRELRRHHRLHRAQLHRRGQLARDRLRLRRGHRRPADRLPGAAVRGRRLSPRERRAPLAVRRPDRRGRGHRKPGRRQRLRADRLRQRRHHRGPDAGAQQRLPRHRAQRSEQRHASGATASSSAARSRPRGATAST